MGFMDELKKLTTPYEDDDDFFEGADMTQKPTPTVSAAQLAMEDTFGSEAMEEPEPLNRPARPAAFEGGLLGALGMKRPAKSAARPAKPMRERTVNFGGSETQVILFNPKTFEEAGELVSHLEQNRSVVMSLEGLATENARRLLDFVSGITFAMQGKVTPVAAKAYFITPQNVEFVAPQSEQPESDGQYF